MFLNVYLSEFFWHTLMRRFCCCCLEELEVWIPYEMRFLYQLLLEEGKTSNIELRKIHFLQMQYKPCTKVL